MGRGCHEGSRRVGSGCPALVVKHMREVVLVMMKAWRGAGRRERCVHACGCACACEHAYVDARAGM